MMYADFNATLDVFWAWSHGGLQPSSLVAGIEMIITGGVRIVWRATPGLHYGVQYKDLLPASWIELPGQVSFEEDRGMMDDPAPVEHGHRYYRVVLLE